MSLSKGLQKETAEASAEDLDGEQEFTAAGDPAFVIGRQAAGGDHAVEVRMKVQILSPGVEQVEEAGGYAQTLRIGGNGQQGFGDGAEEDVVDDILVEESDLGDGRGQSEDHVEVLGGQQFGLSLLQPLGACQSLALRAVSVPAGAITGMRVLALIAPFDHTVPQGRGG